MSRYIDVEPLEKALKMNANGFKHEGSNYVKGFDAAIATMKGILQGLPTANVAPISDTVRKMHFEIQQRCIKGGIYPAFVGCTVDKVAYEMTGDEFYIAKFRMEDVEGNEQMCF